MDRSADISAQIIVAGFHRSGTSMAMQSLKKAGLYIGDSLLGAAPSNPDGHFEDVETMTLHDRWLRAAGTDWCCTEQPPAVSDEEATLGIEPIIERLGRDHLQWGLKDPRISLYLSEWFNQLNNPVSVLVYRHYASCANSLRRRQTGQLMIDPSTQFEDIRFWADPTLALRSWLVHNQAIIQHYKKHPKRCVLISQEAQIAGVNLPALVNSKLSVALTVNNDTGVDAEKTTNDNTIKLNAKHLQEELEDTWNELQALSDVRAEHYPVVNWNTSEEPINELELTLTLKQLQRSWDELGVPASGGTHPL